ncbi:hypothetical protein Zmor_023431 [Zophobas morio]|uniref:Protein msta n=1 Tax=Zophobas morio TaxID=2755281 RepID=A0AA38HYP4_9CUCU|nr:hypothetical protein Zmor_023431 [Zophobas morio]
MDAKADEKLQVLETKQCEVCQKPAIHRCGGCRRVCYCSKQHQQDHWEQHKNVCRSYKICQNDDHSRHVVATRSLTPGEFILLEPPLIWGPSFNTVPICLGCGKAVNGENSRPCNKCGWPVCSTLCEKSPSHLPECRYTIQRGERVHIKKFGVPQPIYRCITILRCLYHKQFLPRSWKKLEKLLSSLGNHTSTVTSENEKQTIAEFIRRFFKVWAIFSMEDVMKVCEMVMINSHEVRLTDPPFIAIYSTTSMIEHNCRPNCTKSFTNLGQILITAAVPIQEGDNLSISYTDPLSGTQSRRYFLHETKFFWCRCERCEDPTELGTNFSALKCQSPDCDGYLLPKTFTDVQTLPDWICNICSRCVSSYSAHDVLERIEHDLYDLDKANVEECKHFLRTYESYLHENHFYFAGVEYIFCQLLGKSGVQLLSDEDLELKFHYCCHLESLLKVLAPAEKCILGTVLFEKFSSIMEIRRRKGSQELKNNHEECRAILHEVTELLKNEPDCLPEGKIYQKARAYLSNEVLMENENIDEN